MFLLHLCSNLRHKVVQTPQEDERLLGDRLRYISKMILEKLENDCWQCILDKGLPKVNVAMLNAAKTGHRNCVISFSVDVELVRKRDKAFECMTNVTIKQMLAKVVRKKLVKYFVDQNLEVVDFPAVTKINENESKIFFKFKFSWY